MIKELIEQLMRDIKPDWEYWRDRRTATIQEAVLLSLDICPVKAKELGNAIFNSDTKSLYARRMEIIADWLPTLEYVDRRGGDRVFGDRLIDSFYQFCDWMVNERKWTGLPVHIHDLAIQYQASLPPIFDFSNPAANFAVQAKPAPKPVRPWIPRAQELGAAYCRTFIGHANPAYCTKRQTAKHVANLLEKEGYRTKGDGVIDYQTVEKDAFSDGWWPRNNPSLKVIPRNDDHSSA